LLVADRSDSQRPNTQLSGSEGSEASPLGFLKATYAAARNKYKPVSIEILWIAESPPSSQGFFYFERTIGKDHLFRETMKAIGVWPENRKMSRDLDKRPYLMQFQSRGYFLIDTCETPVDKLDYTRRVTAVLQGARRIVNKVEMLRPRRILILKVNVFKAVKSELEKAGLSGRLLNSEPIPFPSHGWQLKYRTKVKQLIG